MNFKKFIFIPVFCIVLSVFSPVFAQTADQWISMRSPNFYLVGNADEIEIRRVATKLEQFRFVFTQLFAEMKFTSPVQTTVIVFRDEKSMTPFKPSDENGKPKDWVKGFFLPDYDVNYIVLSAETNKQEDFTTIFHEYVHFLVDNTLGRINVPPWFNEGLAEYYEQFQVENERKITLGNVNKTHLALLQKNGIMPFEKFFGIDYQTLHRQPKENVISYYAQAWALTHYLNHGNKGARSKQFQLFSKLVIGGKSANDAFAEAFQTDFAAMEKDLKKYIGQKNFEVSNLNSDKYSFTEISLKVAPISTAEAKAVQGDLLFHSNHRAEAKKFIEDALTLNPELSSANASYGLLKFNEKNYAEAQKYLEKAIENDSKNYFAYFSLAYILSRKDMTTFGFVVGYDAAYAEQIRNNLRKAIELNPDFAESYQLFAFVNAVRNENLDEGIEMIKKALEIAPGNQIYNLRYAELLMRKRDFTNARKITQKIIQTSADDQSKIYALNTLNQINVWESQLREIEENKKRPQTESTVTDKVLSEEEIQKLNARAMLESLNQALRKPKTDEKRILGLLQKVDCNENGVIYSVKSNDKIIYFRSDSVNEITLTNFVSNFATARFGCDLYSGENFAVITFRPFENSKTNLSGELKSIEFVPPDFVFLDLSQIKNKTHF
jgi:tetratricopeptide (TPR) repeat protein